MGLLVPVAADVDYYRCYRCANVWIMPKDEPEPSASATISLNVERYEKDGECDGDRRSDHGPTGALAKCFVDRFIGSARRECFRDRSTKPVCTG